MKILHTADWHLGKIVNSVRMTDDQAYILDKFIEIVKKEQPDVIIIAGDIYDRAVPPKEAVELLNNILTKLITDFKIPVLAIAGNHDSPDRLEFGNQLFRSQQLYIETKITKAMQPVVIEDAYGPVYFHLVPYIEPAEARGIFEDDNIHSHQTAMEAIVNTIKANHNMAERHILIGHAFLAGGMESESEERLSMVGGTPYIDAAIFEDFNYVAMGHLHQAQRVKSETVRYSGSILKYSFSEATHKKSVTFVELSETGDCELSFEALVPRVDMRVVEGYFADLMNEPLQNKTDYLHIQLLDDGQIIDPMNKLRMIYPNILRLERKKRSDLPNLNDLKTLKEQQKKSHAELFASFYEEIKGEPITEEKQAYMEKVIAKILVRERGE